MYYPNSTPSHCTYPFGLQHPYKYNIQQNSTEYRNIQILMSPPPAVLTTALDRYILTLPHPRTPYVDRSQFEILIYASALRFQVCIEIQTFLPQRFSIHRAWISRNWPKSWSFDRHSSRACIATDSLKMIHHRPRFDLWIHIDSEPVLLPTHSQWSTIDRGLLDYRSTSILSLYFYRHIHNDPP